MEETREQLATLFEAMKGAELEVSYDDDGSYMLAYRASEIGSLVTWDFFPNGNVLVCLVNADHAKPRFAFSLRDYASPSPSKDNMT